MIRRLTQPASSSAPPPSETSNESYPISALKHLFCGGVAGSAAKTVTAPLSRLTILFQVHSLVTTKENRPKYSPSLSGGLKKIIERGGILSLWKGNGTSVLHRFPFSAINFHVYENMLDWTMQHRQYFEFDSNKTTTSSETDDPPPLARLISGGVAGCTACVACYPLDLVRTRLTTELPGQEHYKGITDAFAKIVKEEGIRGLYAGISPTLFVAIPNFAISYTVYGTLKEYVLDDDLFYNLRIVDVDSGQESLGLKLTLLCGAASGSLSTLVTFPFDTVRRRMQIQNLHISKSSRLSAMGQIKVLMQNEGIRGLYRGLTPELLKVVPMVGTMFVVYEYLKVQLNVESKRR
jgi:solute carrier family 25 (mitochondrial phosphate transporter), member 23/24/25/41